MGPAPGAPAQTARQAARWAFELGEGGGRQLGCQHGETAAVEGYVAAEECAGGGVQDHADVQELFPLDARDDAQHGVIKRHARGHGSASSRKIDAAARRAPR